MALRLAALPWTTLDTQIVLVGALCAAACALLGSYLVLRKMSMLGDAISHAVLPGLAAAFLLSGSRSSFVMLLGAAVVAVLTAGLTEWLHRAGKVDEGAAMGVVFTTLFALGLILLRQGADHVDLDPDCVLYGMIEFVPLDTRSFLGLTVPRVALVLGPVLLVNALFVILFYKELKICAFDPALATTLGFRAGLMHYVLMVLVAITTVAAFESVGSILVIAMLIVPPATAGLLTERLGRLLVLSVLLAVLSALLGHAGAIAVPGWLGYAGSTNTAGMMGVAAGLLFGLAFLAAPRAGLISRAVQRLALTLRIIREDMLGLLFRIEEVEVARGGAMAPAGAVAPASGRWTPGAAELRQAVAAGRLTGALALRGLRQAGLVAWSQGAFALTVAGRAAARDLVRSHRLWEVYLAQRLAMPVGRLHDSAERLEHVTDAGLRERLAQTLAHPQTDPHGARIPAASPPADAP